MKLHRSLCWDLSYLTRAMCLHCEQSSPSHPERVSENLEKARSQKLSKDTTTSMSRTD